mmetsp:Transcript_21336/g.50623  ORF Transcript_21336/g.50623 Transcript_21336/m.50623 type:complete len:201 (+) Transcript_21336:151-753(+)
MSGFKRISRCMPCIPEDTPVPQNNSAKAMNTRFNRDDEGYISPESSHPYQSADTPSGSPTNVQSMTLARWHEEVPRILSRSDSGLSRTDSSFSESEPEQHIEILVPLQKARSGSLVMKKQQKERMKTLLQSCPDIPAPELPLNVSITARWDPSSTPSPRTGRKQSMATERHMVSAQDIRQTVILQGEGRPNLEETGRLAV